MPHPPLHDSISEKRDALTADHANHRLGFMRILVPDSVPFDLTDFPLEVISFDPKADTSSFDAEALIVWGYSRHVLKPLLEMPKLRWVQTLSAGVDHVLALDPRAEIAVANGRGLHDAPTAELAVALLLAATRRLHHFRDAQKKSQWDRAAYQHALSGGELLTLEGARVLIVGMGSIGLEIAKRLTPFGCVVEGLARTAGSRGGYDVHVLEDFERIIPNFDAVILVLPDTDDTHGFISSQRLQLFKRTAWLVNVGRGSAIDEPALISALQTGQLGGAALDVTAREPLPEDSPLWSLENLILTPHIGGGGPHFYRKAEALLRRNAQLFLDRKPLENVIDRARGY
jgi:phosphoglycerate dehydrogenase-like enzyme